MMLLNEGTITYQHPSEAVNCPLAQQLFSFSGVKSVFITANFVTVTKAGEIEWYEITNIIREYIRGFLMAGEKVFTRIPGGETAEGSPASEELKIENSGDNAQTAEKIIQLLDEYVKPAVEQDGGAIHFRSFEDGIVTVTLKGSCSGCPSSTLTLKSGIENLLRQMIPEVKEVIAES